MARCTKWICQVPRKDGFRYLNFVIWLATECAHVVHVDFTRGNFGAKYQKPQFYLSYLSYRIYPIYPICLFVYLTVYLFLYLYLYLYLYTISTISIFIYLYLCIVSMGLSIYLSVCMYVYFYIYIYLYTCTCNYVYHILNISNVLHVWYMFTDLYPKHDPMYVYKYNVLKHVTYGYLLHTFQ
jgi:hypothetical protein